MFKRFNLNNKRVEFIYTNKLYILKVDNINYMVSLYLES